MKLKLPDIKEQLDDADIEDYSFWEEDKYINIPVIDNVEETLELESINILFGISNNDVGVLYGWVQLGEGGYTTFDTLIVETEDFKYSTKSQLKSAYKKCRKELLKKYKECILQLFERN